MLAPKHTYAYAYAYAYTGIDFCKEGVDFI